MQVKHQSVPQWSVHDSIFAQRKKENESRDLYDTEKVWINNHTSNYVYHRILPGSSFSFNSSRVNPWLHSNTHFVYLTVDHVLGVGTVAYYLSLW